MKHSGVLPEQVVKRDGRLAPFEVDKITRSLFAVTEDLGRPNAFLARELTDGVLHFLVQEVGDDKVRTSHIADLAAKVVRELGQPELAAAYERGRDRSLAETPADKEHQASATSAPGETSREAVAALLQSYSLTAVYSRDLAAAHEEGLIQLGGLDRPEQLVALLAPGVPVNVASAVSFLEQTWQTFGAAPGETVFWDSPEYALDESSAALWLRSLPTVCAVANRRAALHLHAATPPAWAQSTAAGPLFAASSNTSRECILDKLLDAWDSMDQGQHVTLTWHVGEKDYHEAAPLVRWLRQGTRQGSIRIALDRPRREVLFGAGLDRHRPAVLGSVGLGLGAMLARPGVDGDVTRFLHKLPSLVRMGVRAGVQKRNYLRRALDARLAAGFLLERASFVLTPVGLDQIVRQLVGHSLDTHPAAIDLARQVIEVLQGVCTQESRATGLPLVVGAQGETASGPTSAEQASLVASCPLDAAQLQRLVARTAMLPDTTLWLRGRAADLMTAMAQLWKKTDLETVFVMLDV